MHMLIFLDIMHIYTLLIYHSTIILINLLSLYTSTFKKKKNSYIQYKYFSLKKNNNI